MKKSIVFVVLSCLSPLATGQDEALLLDEIEVTSNVQGSYTSQAIQVGTFRDTDPIDVPLTTNIVTREVLDAQDTNTLFGALRNTAGVTRSQLNGSTYDNISIRGILVENRGNYRLNGSLPVINLIDIPLENKERVEVLKGASSLYYGLVPPSGIVNLITKRAGTQENKSLTLRANEHAGYSAHMDYGNRFGDAKQFGARINLLGGIEDIGVDRYEGDRGLASVALDWRASEQLMFKLDVEHYRKDVSEQAAIALLPAAGGRITLPPVPDEERNLAGKWQKYDAEATNLLFRTDYFINDNWSVLFEAGRARTERDRNYSQFQNYDIATGDGMLRVFFTRGQEFVNTNYRMELFGRVPTGPVVHELSLGATTNKRESDTPLFAGTTFAQNYYDPVAIPKRSPAASNGLSLQTIDDKGIYFFDRMLLGDKWQVMLGMRASDYESTTTRAGSSGVTRTRYETNETTPSASLMYKILPNLTLYTSYIEGLEESGTAPASRANAGELLNPAKSKQKEVGFKTRLFQNTLVQLAYFDIERPSTFVNASNEFTLNGLAEYRGLEFAATGEISRNWAIAASAMLMDAEQLNRESQATHGNVPENTPEKTASLFAEYRVTKVPGLSVSGGLYYVGERAANNQNQAFIDAYTIYSAGARYATRMGDERITYQLTVDNLTNRNYWSTAGNGLLGAGLPRTIKASMRIDF